jgi:multiple sugar transport system permease protein
VYNNPSLACDSKTEYIRGDIFYWGELMGAALIASVPVAIAYNLFLDRFISGITGGAVK